MHDLIATLPAEIQKAAAIAAAACFFLIVSSTRRFPLLRALVLLPSTFLHELSHLTVGFLTGGRPSGFSIIPRRRDQWTLFGGVRSSWLLGSVTLSRPGFFSCFPTGLAPLALFPAAWLILKSYAFGVTFQGDLCRYVLAAVVATGALPSRQDVRVAFSRLGGAMFYMTVIPATLLYFRLTY